MKNYKNILYQFLAGLGLMVGFKQLFFLGNIELLELISSMGKESFAYFANKSDRFGISNALQKLIVIKIVLGFVAIGINYVILFLLAFKKRLNWNISFAITIILIAVHYFNWIELSPLSLGSLNLIVAYTIPVVLTFVASFIFYMLAFRTSSK